MPEPLRAALRGLTFEARLAYIGLCREDYDARRRPCEAVRTEVRAILSGDREPLRCWPEGQVATCVPLRRSGMIGPVKGRTPAVLAAIAFFAGAGTAHAQFTVEGAVPDGRHAAQRLRGRLQRRRPAGRRGLATRTPTRCRCSCAGPEASREETGSPFAAPGATSNGTVGDFNGDGLPDLAISDFDFCNGVVIALRNPAGGFTRETVPLGGGNRERRRRGRLQPRRARRPRRRQLRLAATSASACNTGTGFTLRRTNYADRHNPRQIAVADFNGDGAADIAVLNNGSANVMMLLNTGGGDVRAGGRADRGRHATRTASPPATSTATAGRISPCRTPATTPSRSCSRSPLGGFTVRGAGRGRRPPDQPRAPPTSTATARSTSPSRSPAARST